MPLSKSTFQSLSTSLKAGKYNLLLGAGASRDSKNHNGHLPSGEEIRRHLCTIKGARSTSSLQRLYATLTPSEVAEHIVDRFLDCTPGPSVTKITRFLWRRIFTFNIDDALEHAYNSSPPLQTPVVFHYKDDYNELSNLTEVPIVHLHGWVRQRDAGFVFSRDEYVRQTESINPWMVVLTQFLPVEPFIILGASLDEVDLDYYLAHRTAVTSREDIGPSILVEPNPDPVTQTDCEKYNLLLYEGTAEQFLDDLLEHVPDRPTPIDLVPKKTRNILAPNISEIDALSFAADFELIPGIVLPSTTVSRFFYGQPPSWQDLAGNRDIGRPITTSILQAAEKHFKDPGKGPKIALIEDQTGVGKTTVVRRCIFELASRGINSFICTAVSRIEPVSSARVIDAIDGPIAFLVDDFADHVTAIRELSERLTKRDVLFLCAERNYRSQYVAQTLSGYDLELERFEGLQLREIDSERLLETYREHGLLGAPEARRNRQVFATSIKDDPIAIACCRILNDFRPMDQILASLTETISDEDLRRYLTSALACHCFRSGVRFSVLHSICSRASWARQISGSHEMPLYIHSRQDFDDFVVPENGTLASLVLRRISETDSGPLLSVFVDLANAIASRVNPQQIVKRAPEARIAARLFDYDQVVLPLLHDRAGLFYLETKYHWSWNSRYWTQVALMYLTKHYDRASTAEGAEALENACHHARHAASIEKHPVVLSTLGKVLLAQMNGTRSSLSAVFDEAFSALREAIELQRSWLRPSEHPFVSLFRGVREYTQMGGTISTHQLAVLREIRGEAIESFRGDGDVQNALEMLDRSFEPLRV